MPRLIDPEQLPDLTEVDVDEVRAAAARMRRDGEDIRNTARELATLWRGGLDPAYSAPEAPDLLEALMPLVPRGDEVADNSQRSARGLDVYADEVEPVKKRSWQVRQEATLFRARMRVLGDEWDKDPANVAENDRLWGEGRKLEAAFEQAGSAAAQAVRAASAGQGGPYAGAGAGPRISAKELRALADAHAKGIKQALADGDPELARRALEFYAGLARRLQDQPIYLERLYDRAGTEIAGMGRWLATNPADDKTGGQLFSPGDGAILGGFGAGLAALSNKGLGTSIPPPLLKTLLSPKGDKFSHGMLLKYGPKGDQWDRTFLAEMGKTMLEWKRDNPFIPPEQRDIDPARYQPGSSDWWVGLDIGDAPDKQIAKMLAEHDPTAATMSRVAENAPAARIMLADEGAARDLISNEWWIKDPNTPEKRIDVSGPAAEVIRAATADPAAPNATQAARNLFVAAANWEHDAEARTNPSAILGLPKPEGPPTGINRALAGMGTRYIEELSRSVDNSGGLSKILDNGKLKLDTDDLKGYLSTLAKDPTSLGIFRGAVDQGIVDTVSGKRPGDLNAYGQLSGITALAHANENYTAAEMKDMVNARSLQLIEWATGAPIKNPIPIPDDLKGPADWVKWATSPGRSDIKDKILEVFDTGNAARASQANERDYILATENLRIPIAQGLLEAVASGKENWPRGKTIPSHLVKNGRIHLATPSDYSDFDDWFQSMQPEDRKERDPTGFRDQLEPGFDRETSSHKDTWYK